MNMDGEFRVGSNLRSKLLLLPYTETNLYMIILLPEKRYDLENIERDLTMRKFWTFVNDTLKAAKTKREVLLYNYS